MDLNLNWDSIFKEQADEAAASVLPVNDYNITVVKSEGTKASTGSPMIKLTCEVSDGPFKGKRLWTNIVLKSDSPGAMRMALKKLAGLGLSREWLAENNPSVDMIASNLAGRSGVAKVTQREYKGEQKNEIDTFKLGGADSTGGVPAPPAIGGTSSLPDPMAGLPPEPEAPAPAPAAALPQTAAEVPAPPAVATPDETATGEKDPF